MKTLIEKTSDKLVKAFNSVESARRGLSRGFAKLKQDITKLRNESKKGIGTGGRIRRGVGRDGRRVWSDIGY